MATNTNTKAASALRGQNALVTLSAAEAVSKLPTIVVGQKAVLSSSSKVGYVDSVDYLGLSYQITPITPDNNLASSTTPGILAASETITLTP